MRGESLTEDAIDQMSLVRPDERGEPAGVVGFRSWVRAFLRTGLPVVFLPGGFHLPTIPPHRKVNAVDLGTADKVAVGGAGALVRWPGARRVRPLERSRWSRSARPSRPSWSCGTGGWSTPSAGTRGPIGIRSSGAWDGEIAYWRSPLSKDDLFRGGLDDLGPAGPDAFRESLTKHVAGLQAVTPFERIYLSGRGLNRPDIARLADRGAGPARPALPRFPALPGAWVKHAAQGSAILADALAGGRSPRWPDHSSSTSARGSIWDAIARPARP